jgi:hypothetical protein
LRNRVALEAAKELRSDLVTGREEEKIEEYDLDDGRDLDVELADQDTGQQSADDYPKAEAPELDATDEEADREREEDRQLGIVPQRVYEVVDGPLPSTGAPTATASWRIAKHREQRPRYRSTRKPIHGTELPFSLDASVGSPECERARSGHGPRPRVAPSRARFF